ncbi:hypothetical protein SISNIDRAFT_485226 [Sistotremastrum niveocremeum HHB9708]|uniref:Uncharacterized protein n=1 Tax=Sistotremastrum niveocremeum HHB9708 TaxID=1314777 RepID=A0A164UX10_9AGAM|nr:hypothetical protein SISNIDRAFT_485226 [Sistotremastrum niveocremeum HHB9708]
MASASNFEPAVPRAEFVIELFDWVSRSVSYANFRNEGHELASHHEPQTLCKKTSSTSETVTEIGAVRISCHLTADNFRPPQLPKLHSLECEEKQSQDFNFVDPPHIYALRATAGILKNGDVLRPPSSTSSSRVLATIAILPMHVSLGIKSVDCSVSDRIPPDTWPSVPSFVMRSVAVKDKDGLTVPSDIGGFGYIG